jgi:hypothetical protein
VQSLTSAPMMRLGPQKWLGPKMATFRPVPNRRSAPNRDRTGGPRSARARAASPPLAGGGAAPAARPGTEQ